MKILELFRRLSYGQLSNLALSGEGSGTIAEDQQPKLIGYADEALLKLYGRFKLKDSEVIIEQVEGRTFYPLKRKFAETAGARVKVAFIKDLPDEPFQEDVIKILEVNDACGARPLNDAGRVDSLFTPQPDVLQVPIPLAGQPLSIVYQARHPKLDDRAGHLINQEIEIPFFLEAALLNFIAYKTYCHMNTQDNILKGQEYLAAYEADCLDVEQRDLANQTASTSHTKLEQRGFV